MGGVYKRGTTVLLVGGVYKKGTTVLLVGRVYMRGTTVLPFILLQTSTVLHFWRFSVVKLKIQY